MVRPTGNPSRQEQSAERLGRVGVSRAKRAGPTACSSLGVVPVEVGHRVLKLDLEAATSILAKSRSSLVGSAEAHARLGKRQLNPRQYVSILTATAVTARKAVWRVSSRRLAAERSWPSASNASAAGAWAVSGVQASSARRARNAPAGGGSWLRDAACGGALAS